MSRKKLFGKYTNMRQIKEIQKQEEVAPVEVQNKEVIGDLRYIGVWDTDQEGEIWVEIESAKGCFSGFIKEVK